MFISIHTTLAGGDWVFSEDFVPGEIFQSTPPSRVATISSNSFDMSSSISIHTTLAGGDIKIRDSYYGKDISIHTTLAGGDITTG